jgi:hypothetical protein
VEKIIYMPLLQEGTDCWRPVRAVQMAEDIFKVLDHIPADESWAFAPDARVRCKNHVFSNGDTGLVVFKYAVEDDPHYQLLKLHERELFHVVFADGEESVVRVVHVDGADEKFIYDLLSTNPGRRHRHNNASYVASFADLVSATLEK